MPRPMTIACLQTRPQPSFDTATGEALALARRAVDAGAEMLFLPEYCGGLCTDGPAVRPPSAPEAQHPVLQALRDFASEQGIWTMIGSLAIDAPQGRIVNRGYMISDTGQIVGQYDKMNLFDVDLGEGQVYRESNSVLAGRKAVVHDTPFGRIGHTICYDLRFPHLFRSLAQAGAEIIVCPAAFTKTTGEAHWHVLNRARAIENTCFIVSPCAVGPVPGGGESYGHSLVVDPWGEVLADGGDAPGVVMAELDLDMVAETAARVPSLKHDRPFTHASDPERIPA